MERVAPDGPHCSTTFEDRWAEMMDPDYQPSTVPRWLLEQWREEEWRRMYAVGHLAVGEILVRGEVNGLPNGLPDPI